MQNLLPILGLIFAVAFPTVGLIVAVARGFARMEVRFSELKGMINQHAIDLLRVESDLRTDITEVRNQAAINFKDHEDRLRELERNWRRGAGGNTGENK